MNRNPNPEGGWPRNPEKEQLRLYADKPEGYFLVDVTEEMRNPDGCFTAICNVYESSDPCLCTSSVSPVYITQNRLKRVQWSELPKEWQEAFAGYLLSNEKPENVPGFWRVRHFQMTKGAI